MARLLRLASVSLVLLTSRPGFAVGPADVRSGPVPVIVEFAGQEVVYFSDRQTAFARGGVEVVVRRRDAPDWWVRVTAAEVTADLVSGVVDAADGVRVETPYSAFAGVACHFDFSKGNLWVKQSSATVDLGLTGLGSVGQAFFSGEEVGGRPEVYYVIRGRITTCDRPNPHWAIEARELAYSTRTGRLKIRGGRVRLYGKSIPLVSPLSFGIGPAREKESHLPGSPGYSSREGLYLRGSLRFSGEDRTTVLSTSYRLGLRRGWTGYIGADHPDDVNEWRVGYTRAEPRYFKLRDYFSLDRAPEASFTHHFVPVNSAAASRRSLDLTASAGYYREKPDRRDLPRMSAGRFSLSLDAGYNLAGRELLEGTWAGWSARYNLYDTGERYGLLELYAGFGSRLSDQLVGGLSLRHHITTGKAALLMDVPDLRTELAPEVRWDFHRDWRLVLEGRYDLSDDRLADYTVELQRQAHCLTWFARYQDASESWMVGVALSGMTPRVKGYKQEARVSQENTRGDSVGHSGP
ncbi:MAG: hypothetical protein N2512_02765 [Armatimonadetes bacterium]|nr:hypothetical protein [Armatimonadota bacterium]